MNKTLNINIGGYPFIINDDAYELLSRYLGSIHQHFKTSESYGEITGDIESRLAEIFQEKLGARQIIEMRDIQNAIEIMGKPEDFGAEPLDNPGNGSSFSRGDYRTGKRLFRDPEDKVFGGVCSGIAAYFGISDPLWVRILFVILVFVFGLSIIFYFVLWVAIPEAISSADRLAMRGQPINVSNIAKVVEEEFNNISESISNVGKNSAEKKNNSYAAGSNFKRGRASQGIADIFSFIGEMFRRIFDVLRLIFKPIFGFFGVIGLIVLACLWIAVIIAFAYGHPFLNAFFGQQKMMAYIAGTNVFFLIASVIAILIMFFLNLFFKFNIKPRWYAMLGGFWFINALSFAYAATNIAKDFSEQSTVKTEVFNAILPSDTLHIHLIRDKKGSHREWDGFTLNGSNFKYKGAHMSIEKAEGNEFRLVKEVRANGSSIEDAEESASQLAYSPILEGNTLTCNESIDISGIKFRAQHVNLTLYVPENKYVKIEEYANDNFISFSNEEDNDCDSDDDGKEIWQMQSNGSMVCPEAKKQNSAIKTYSNINFNTLKVRGLVDVEIVKGSNFEVKVEGKDKLLSKIDIIQSDKTLNIRSNIDDDKWNWDSRRSNVKLIITMPTLDLVDIEGRTKVEITGFSQSEMKINLFGELKADIVVNVDNLSLDIEKAKVELQGKGQKLNARVEESGELKARQYTVKDADIELKSGAEAEIYATDNVEQRGDSDNLDLNGGATLRGKNKKEL
ncbi:MAG: GIN domain-containing protein [Saprospiraceae bacterium]